MIIDTALIGPMLWPVTFPYNYGWLRERGAPSSGRTRYVFQPHAKIPGSDAVSYQCSGAFSLRSLAATYGINRSRLNVATLHDITVYFTDTSAGCSVAYRRLP